MGLMVRQGPPVWFTHLDVLAPCRELFSNLLMEKAQLSKEKAQLLQGARKPDVEERIAQNSHSKH